VGTTTSVNAGKCEGDGVDGKRSETAQQVSACACVTRGLPVPGALPAGCIGHCPSCAQHTMRASGVLSQPAHCTKLLIESALTTTNAARRIIGNRTP